MSMDLSFLQGDGLEYLGKFLTSLAIGLLIGLERERGEKAKAGLRTFALTALFGTLAAMLADETGSAWVLGVGLFIVGISIVTAYFKDLVEINDPGTTTHAAMLVCYGLGAAVWFGYSKLAVMLAIVTTALLYFKPELRGFSQDLSRRDLVSILQFAVLSFVVLPILPDRTYGPYEALNPHQIWLMVVLIAGVSLAGYIALRFAGQRYGAALLGLLGGLVSSTATTLVYARHARNEGMRDLAVIVIVLANLVVLVRLAIVSAVASAGVLPKLAPVLGGGLALGLIAAFYWWRRLGSGQELPVPETSNPTELKTALGFGALYAVVLFLAAWLSDVAGRGGLYGVAFVSGLTDVDAITLSSLRLFDIGRIEAIEAVTAITIALIANIVFKLGLVFFIGGASLAWRAASGMLAVATGAGATLVALRF
jgi:uncharacterized membrane protein (DUF4010 family)